MTAWRQALHSLLRRPAFALTAVLTLAFGIGTTTAFFSVVDAVLIRPLPYPQSGRLVAVYEASPSTNQAASLIAPVRLDEWNRASQTFVSLSGSYAESVTDTSVAEPERLEGRRVMPRFFDVLGMPPLIGRTFTPEEDVFGGPGAAVIHEALWTRRYGRSPSVLGQALVIEGRPFTIVGVMPAAFSAASTDMWLPAQLVPWLLQVREARFVNGVGRLKPGVTPAQAQADLDRVQRALGEAFPKSDSGWSASVADLKDTRVRGHRRPLSLVFGAVALLLAIAVANIAGLMLVQLRRRAREIAIRTALGASRPQIMAAVMRETGIVAAAGAVAGAVIATALVALFKSRLTLLPRVDEIGLDWRAIAIAALASTIAAVVCGLLPVWVVTRREHALAMTSDARAVAGGQHRLQQVLVTGQVALSLLLVASAGMLLRSYANLTRVDVGFNAEDVITFRVGAAWGEDLAAIGGLQARLIAELERRPDVQAAGITSFLPATGATLRYQVAVGGLTGPDTNGAMTAGSRLVSAGYLRALQVPLVSGEWCPDFTMDTTKPRTILVNQQFVDTFGQGQTLVGREMRLLQNPTAPVRIAGIVGNMAEDGASAAMAPYVYSCDAAGTWPDPQYVVRTRDRDALLREIPRIVRGLSPTRAVRGAHAERRAVPVAGPAASGRPDARVLRRGGRDAGGPGALQPVHAAGLGAGAGARRTAGPRRGAGPRHAAGARRRRPPRDGWRADRAGADDRGEPGCEDLAVRGEPARRADARGCPRRACRRRARRCGRAGAPRGPGRSGGSAEKLS